MEKEKAPAKKKTPKAPEENPSPGVLETVAKAIGTTIGEVAVKTGVVSQPPKTHRKKLAAKSKSRLPRKLKKQQKKESQKSGAK